MQAMRELETVIRKQRMTACDAGGGRKRNDLFISGNFNHYSTSTYVVASGNALAEARVKIDNLQAYARRIREEFEDALVRELGNAENATVSASDPGDIQRPLEIFARLRYVETILLKYLSLFEKVRQELRSLRKYCKDIRREFRRRQHLSFCGVDFTKRIWFLLHGSHPPKTYAFAFAFGRG